MIRSGRFLNLLTAAVLLAIPVKAVAETRFVYDSSGRMIQAIYPNGITIDYVYDSAGNRRQITTSRLANRAPTAQNDNASVNASGIVDIQVRANDSDPDGDPLAVTTASGAAGGGSAVVMNGGTHVRYTAPASGGIKTFTYTVSDGRGGSDTATVAVTVAAINHNPVANDDTGSTRTGANTPIYVTFNDMDPDGNGLTITSVGAPTGGTASIGPGGAYVIYKAPADDGQYSFTYTISDGNGGTATAWVYVDVSSLEDQGP